MKKKSVFTVAVFFLLVGVLPTIFAVQSEEDGNGRDTDALMREEAEDYFRKWLEEDVVYVITGEERSVFESLTTAEEKEQFIEQFWFRRDPDPKTAENEFKEEHYRRIAYTNERYFAGKPGWQTDRGRIYIIHGPPAEIQSHPTGGMYDRELRAGGGETYAYPWEMWRYRNIDGIGDDIMLEFVDKSMTGEYRLSHTPEEDKDALLYIPANSAGPTFAEMSGRQQRWERIAFTPANRHTYWDAPQGYRDNPFYRYEIYSKVHTPPNIKYKDLQELVKVNIEFVNLPFSVRQDYFRLNDLQILVPITVQIHNKDLAFELEEGKHVARVAVYGLVTGINNRVALEFDDDLVTSLRAEELEVGLQRLSVYQKVVPLDMKMRYKVDVVVKDMNTGHTGVLRQAIVPPRFDDTQMATSSFILSDYIEVLETVPDINEMFVLGDVKVRPSLDKEFPQGQDLGLYFQVYNMGIDQSTMTPALSLKYRLMKDGDVLKEIVDEDGESVQFFTNRRTVLVKVFALESLPPGDYQIQVEIKDRLLDQPLQLADKFTVMSAG
jgi:GWxTD domain-containing protein